MMLKDGGIVSLSGSQRWLAYDSLEGLWEGIFLNTSPFTNPSQKGDSMTVGFLGNWPFPIKLAIAIVLDVITAGFQLILIPFWPVYLLSSGAWVLIQSLVLWLFYGMKILPFAMAGAATELAPGLNVIPVMTISALIMGHRTGWRH